MILVIVSINRVYSTKKETADLVTFTEEILSGKLHFLWSGLLMVSPFLYKPKGESVSTRWGHLIFWQRSEALFIKEANTDYHFKQNKNKKWRKISTMVSQVHSGTETTYTSSRKYDCENGNIVTIHILKKYQRNSRTYKLKEKRKIKMNLIHPVLIN